MSNYNLAKVFFLGALSVMTVPYSGMAQKLSSEPKVEFLSDRTYAEQLISKVAFGSCNKPTRDQGFWDVIRAKEPDIMLLLGDNHYGNTSNPVRLKKVYDELAAIPQYSEFRQKIPTFPTWDNHDYGAKYPGRLHPHAEEGEQYVAPEMEFMGSGNLGRNPTEFR